MSRAWHLRILAPSTPNHREPHSTSAEDGTITPPNPYVALPSPPTGTLITQGVKNFFCDRFSLLHSHLNNHRPHLPFARTQQGSGLTRLTRHLPSGKGHGPLHQNHSNKRATQPVGRLVLQSIRSFLHWKCSFSSTTGALEKALSMTYYSPESLIPSFWFGHTRTGSRGIISMV
jgi:hypothetical protein